MGEGRVEEAPEPAGDVLNNDGGLRIIKLPPLGRVRRAADWPDLTLTICLDSR